MDIKSWGRLKRWNDDFGSIEDWHKQLEVIEERKYAIILEEKQLHGIDTEFDEILALRDFFNPYYELGVWVNELNTAQKKWEGSYLTDIDAD